MTTSVQEEDFEVGALQRALLAGAYGEGAVAAFTGYVRVSNEQREVHSMELEHYPGMTQRSIADIQQQAAERWPLLATGVVHRGGKLQPGDQIGGVGVSSAHREAAFSACEFIMDYLKTRAPFWKKELGPDGGRWVAAKAEDESRAVRWREDSAH